MRICCGTDIIEINRIKEAIERTSGFKNKIFTKKEIEYCESKKEQKYQHYAARFAAKEAAFKAITGIKEVKNVVWKDIEVSKLENGRPELKIVNYNFENIDISLSHCKEYAVANVVILYNE